MTVEKRRKDLGLSTEPVSLHLVFLGSPGTGKTTEVVGRALGGVLFKAHLATGTFRVHELSS